MYALICSFLFLYRGSTAVEASGCTAASIFDKHFRLRGGGLGSPKIENDGGGNDDAFSPFDVMGNVLSEARAQVLDEIRNRQGRELAAPEPGTEEERSTFDSYMQGMRSVPKATQDWRHDMPRVIMQEHAIGSRFRRQHTLEARRAMARKLLALGKGVPVVAERLHDGVPLPDTPRPRFLVPANMTVRRPGRPALRLAAPAPFRTDGPRRRGRRFAPAPSMRRCAGPCRPSMVWSPVPRQPPPWIEPRRSRSKRPMSRPGP